MTLSTIPFRRVCIIGLGLMGGSFARALKQKDPSCFITGCNRQQESLQFARGQGFIDQGVTDPAQAVQGADLVVLSSPLQTYPDILKRITPHLGPYTVITDMGSAKQYVVETATRLLKDERLAYFIPAHPIAGSEKSGVEASDPQLFKGKRVVVTPHSTCHKDALAAVQILWHACGAETEIMDAPRHDRLYAENSHLVQLLAYAYMEVLRKVPRNARKLLAQDWGVIQKFTRLGRSNPTMWTDIFLCNAQAIEEVARRFLSHLDQAVAMLQAHDAEELGRWLKEARTKREAIQADKIGFSTVLHAPESPVFPYLYTMPHIIAGALMETVSDARYAGTGLRDFTDNLIAFEDITPEFLLAGDGKVSKPVNLLVKNLKQYLALMAKGKSSGLQKALQKAVAVHGGYTS